ncbi:GNAT family N-acetyltransferase [Aquimarina mytili]|uniref:GNAT family N-acetyltransferase n=1 Tax=Aquimarina mytili TaxID=874423 RepID=A0A937A7S6_9FLAO|nr:GNAT family N-acetyltransferase [Aquimarina mytili]MBL0685804.1 GNAT family N-acetyltransferase [Aquimarina mytili]
MIEIKTAKEANTEILALLGTITYVESHGHFIDNKMDLDEYIKDAFSVSKTRIDMNNQKNVFYIIYIDELPVGYAKLVLNSGHKNMTSKKSCKLERIYILQHFIPLKIGQQFLTFLEEIVSNQQLDMMWLSVYKENKRAIRFYQRNEYKEVGKSTFLVNGIGYENIVFEKKLIRKSTA